MQGEGKLDLKMPKAPFASEKDAIDWLAAEKKAFASKAGEFDKSKEIGHESFDY